jgi:hypothetical protein
MYKNHLRILQSGIIIIYLHSFSSPEICPDQRPSKPIFKKSNLL